MSKHLPFFSSKGQILFHTNINLESFSFLMQTTKMVFKLEKQLSISFLMMDKKIATGNDQAPE